MTRKEIGWHLEEYWHRPDFISEEKRLALKEKLKLDVK